MTFYLFEIKFNKFEESDYTFILSQTKLRREEIDEILKKFNENNPDGKLDKKEFTKLYIQLRPDPPELMENITEYVFNSFDADYNGFISFNEFIARKLSKNLCRFK